MAKKQINEQSSGVTQLIVSKEEFKTVLSDKQTEGQNLYERNVSTRAELEQLKSDYRDWILYISEYLKQSFNKPNNEYRRSFDDEGYTFIGRIGSYKSEIEDCKDLIKRRIDNIRNLIKLSDLFKTSVTNHLTAEVSKMHVNSNEVFIVHGHDEEAKVKTARFIEKLGFRPIILHEQASSGKTIIEKIEEYSNVGFGIILYTPCDKGGKKDDPTLKGRARQNVVFEHGYLIGKIGRKNVCALVKGDVETPNDISGVVYINLDDSDAWHIKVAKKLRNSGYEVDMNKVI
ncbi:nucleotide-binding protein [Nostoc ellipsosporum NOK]|nr:nucleotide-binding protein [Nostoc ellipsosporum NOK]